MSPYLRIVEFRNFKNFKQIDFGPFQPRTFYAIVGDNGVGKSNFVDGLAFVFGERNWDKLRVSSAERLLCRQASAGERDCSVAAVFCMEDEELKRFMRSIDSEGSDVFMINNEVVDFDQYQEELLELKIDMKLPNVIVPQGSIVSMATKTPEQLTHFFEEVSRSSALREEYDYLKRKIAKMSSNISVTKEEINFSSKCLSLSGVNHLGTDTVQPKKEWALFRVYHHRAIEEWLEDKVKQYEVKVAECKSAITLKQSELEEKEKDLMDLSWSESDFEIQFKEEDDNLKIATAEVQAKVEFLEKKLRLDTESLQEVQAMLEKSKEVKRVLERKLNIRKNNAALQGICLDSTCTCFKDFDQNEDYCRLRKQVASQTSEIDDELLTLDLSQTRDSKLFNALELKLRNRLDLIKLQGDRKSQLLAEERRIVGNLQKREHNQEEVKRKVEELESDISEVERQLDSTISQLEDAKRLEDDSYERLMRKSNLSWLQEIFGEEAVICRLKFDRLRNMDDDFDEIDVLNKTVMDVLVRYENCILVNSKDMVEKCSELLQMDNRLTETFIPITECMQELNKLNQKEPAAGILMSECVPTPEGLLQVQEVLRYLTKDIVVVQNEEDRIAMQADGFEVVSTRDVQPQDTKKPQVKADLATLEGRKERLTKDLAFLKKNLREVADQSETAGGPAFQRLARDIIAKRETVSKEIRETQEDIDKCKAEICELEKKKSTRAERINELKRQLSRSKEPVFRDFCAEVGVANIEEYEQPCKACKDKVKRLEWQCEETIISEEMSLMDKDMERIRAKLTLLEGKVAETQNEVERARKELDDELASLAESQQKVDELRSQVLEASAERLEMTNTIHKLKKKIRCIKNERNEFKRTLKQCKWQLDDAKVLTKEAFSYISNESQADGSSPEQSISGESSPEGSEQMEVEGPIEIGPRFIDFDPIKHVKNMTDAVRIYELDRKLHDRMKRWENDDLGCLRKMASRVRNEEARAAAGNAEQRLKRLNKKLKVFEKNFRIVKKERTNSFNRCFRFVSEALKNVYKAVMDSDRAECSLIPINSADPYLDGIVMNCWAPDRRHAMARECLSGGEKTTLAFALILSFDKYHRPPLCVVDEVDSYTDRSKTGNFASVFISKAERSQVFAVSHREDVYKHADVLIMICKDRSVLYLDQREYEDGEPQ